MNFNANYDLLKSPRKRIFRMAYMAKLYFRYGTMGSAKTLNLLAVAHNYRQQGKRILILKPEVDDRFGKELVKSRSGLQERADILVREDTQLDTKAFAGASCLLVDEAQFLSEYLVEQLRDVASMLGIPVICYGLRADFRARLFTGSKRLLELADSVEEIKTTCAYCDRKATMNLKHVDGVATVEGPSIDLGADEKYYPACYQCYTSQLALAKDLINSPKAANS